MSAAATDRIRTVRAVSRTPRAVDGRWRRVKNVALVVSFAAFYALPLIPWARRDGLPNQALLFDFPAGRAYAFGLEFWPQDLFLLALVLIASALALFLTNTLVGRVWCGFSCPQTLWTDVFVMIERRLEGVGGRAGHAPSRWRRWLKQGLWLALALATGLTVVSYFTPARELWPAFVAGSAGAVATFFVLFFSAMTYLLAGYAREAVCLHMCPWPRFQAAMVDRDTRIVAYRERRGEPRGPLKRAAAAPAALGDCVDCGLCVAVCPTRIDIREGLQLGCIGCGLCADACDGVMAKIARPTGLIAFVSERDLAGEQPRTGPASWFRPRTVAYGVLLTVTLVVAGMALTDRKPITLAVEPERSPPFVQMSDGSIRNVYQARLTLRRSIGDALRVEAAGLAGAVVVLSGGDSARIGGEDLKREASTKRILVTVPRADLAPGRTPFRLRVVDERSGAAVAEAETYFWAPGAGAWR